MRHPSIFFAAQRRAVVVLVHHSTGKRRGHPSVLNHEIRLFVLYVEPQRCIGADYWRCGERLLRCQSVWAAFEKRALLLCYCSLPAASPWKVELLCNKNTRDSWITPVVCVWFVCSTCVLISSPPQQSASRNKLSQVSGWKPTAANVLVPSVNVLWDWKLTLIPCFLTH